MQFTPSPERNEAPRDAARARRPRTLILAAVAAIVLLTGWTAFIGAGVLEGWGRRPLAPRNEAAAFASAAKVVIERENAGNVAFMLLDDGRIVAEHFASAGTPVDRDTLFQVASLSKWVTAWGVMKLAEDGRIDLDAPVSAYIARWRLPDGEFDEAQVTVRRLLSHTAGLTDGLGYGGFAPGQPVQTLEASLTKAADASFGADGRVRVGAPPGKSFRYSGGGYALLQLLVEEVAGEPFDAYMQRAVLQPLGMARSTYVLAEDATNTAEFFDADGSRAIHYRFSAPAAASLYTSAADMARFLAAHVAGANGEPAGRGVLRPETLEEMRRPHATQFGAEIWGLGTILYAPNNARGFVIGHDGSHAPAINTAARIDPASGDGVVLLETGHRRLATDLAGEWVFWNTGNVDLIMAMADTQRAFPVLAGGWLAIAIGAVAVAAFVLLRRRRRTRRRHTDATA
jgi:CubicO group peptidase (beta-lactamase class C family)